jgi:accessory colonization factor AcfC
MSKKIIKRILLMLCVGAVSLSALGQTGGTKPKIEVYGPGGPLAPMKECAEIFSKQRNVEVVVIAGPESQWIERAKTDADIIFGGAEYMLTDFALKYPALVDAKERTELYPRAAGILVRKGNPKKINSLDDLTRSGIRIIDVNGAGQLGLWEDMAGAKGLIPGIAKNIALSVKTSAEAIEKWKQMPDLDAWITYESWHYRLKDETDLVRLPQSEKIYRGTPIVITKTAENRGIAQEFAKFLQSAEAIPAFHDPAPLRRDIDVSGGRSDRP